MADYVYKYRANQPVEPRTDGTGYLTFDLTAVYKLQGESDDTLIPVPGRHGNAVMPADDLQAVLDDGGLSNPQKVAAIKELLRTGLTSQLPAVPSDWEPETLDLIVQANDVSLATATDFNDFVTVTLGQVYPIVFSL